MFTQKNQEETRSSANANIEASINPALEIVDNRSQSIAQRRLSERVNKSLQLSSVLHSKKPWVIQRIESIPEERIPVQTHGNCGLFSIIAAMRALGFEDETLDGLTDAIDDFVSESEDTFVGELFTVDLMLAIVNGIRYYGQQVLKARAINFSSPTELAQIFAYFKDIPEVTLLIGYSKPDAYDEYYGARGNWLKLIRDGANPEEIETAKTTMDEALTDKVAVEEFHAKDAHWGMINDIHGDGFVDIADTISEEVEGDEHGYNTLISTRKLFNSNKSLGTSEFGWDDYLDTEEDQVEYNKMDSTSTTKDLSENPRYQRIKSQQMKENMDLSGRIVLIELTARGNELVTG